MLGVGQPIMAGRGLIHLALGWGWLGISSQSDSEICYRCVLSTCTIIILGRRHLLTLIGHPRELLGKSQTSEFPCFLRSSSPALRVPYAPKIGVQYLPH